MRWGKTAFLALVFGMMAAPLLIVAGVSLNAKKRMFFPPDGVSLRWFPEIFETAKWMDALANSVFIAVAAAFIAVSIALPAAYFLWRYKVFYAKALFVAGLVPFALPPVITALGMLVFWSEVGFVGNVWSIAIGHGVFLVTLPLVMISLGLESIDDEIVEAARTMGADGRRMFATVVLPMVLPYMVAGYAFALVLSMNEYIIAFFLGQHATPHPARPGPGQPAVRLHAGHRRGGRHVHPVRRGGVQRGGAFRRSAEAARRLDLQGIGRRDMLSTSTRRPRGRTPERRVSGARPAR